MSSSLRIVRSDGAEMTFDGEYRGGWTIAEEGMVDWLDLPLEVTTCPNVLSDGSSVVGKRVDECERTVEAFFPARAGDIGNARREVSSFLNPKFSFECHLTHYGVTRWAPGELTEVECEIVAEGRTVELTFTMLSPDPFLRSESGNENYLTDSNPMFGFPYVSHFRQPLPDGSKKPFGFLASRLIFDGKNTVYNSGDVETNYVIRCEFDGDISNPKFIKDDKHIQVLDMFKKGDVLEIDFTAAPPKVTKNGENIIQMTSRDSDFIGMEMHVGGNVFNYECSDASKRALMGVQILFNKKYLGI